MTVGLELRPALHLILHVAIPAALAWWLFRERFRPAALVMIATMVVDLDHLTTTPIYAPARCSIDLHPLHAPWIFGVYLLLAATPGLTRWLGLGLIIHMALDGVDCVWMVL